MMLMVANEIDGDSVAGAQSGLTEPMYTLRGSDPVACLVLMVWASVHERLGTITPEQLFAATWMSSAMECWARAHGEDVDKTIEAWADVLSTAHARIQAMIAERANSAVH
jgi:hypothetical protein